MTNQEAEARPRRFKDQKGIALQTVIIMVVLLAIAGGVAAVLLQRGGEATDDLNRASAISQAQIYRINNKSLCENSGGTFHSPTTTVDEDDGTGDIDRDGSATTQNVGVACVPK